MKESIKAVIFDFDGTIYFQKPVQAYNLFRIAYRVAINPRLIGEVSLIRHYRKLREDYSKLNIPILKVEEDLARLKNCSANEIAAVRDYWLIESQSLAIKIFRRKKLLKQINKLQRDGVLIVIWSDYPIRKKSKRISLHPDFTASSEAPQIKIAKPNPAGLYYILRSLDLKHTQVIMIGDRDDRDGEAARSAGVQYFKVGKEANMALKTLIAQLEIQ
jgi:HAD superfamily hydrolase (TIGR01549 family)